MDIHERKLKLIQWILELEDEDTLAYIEELTQTDPYMVSDSGGFPIDLKTLAFLKAYNEEVERADAAIDAGKGISMGAALKQMKQWPKTNP